MRGVAQSSEVRLHRAEDAALERESRGALQGCSLDKHAVVGRCEELVAVDLEDCESGADPSATSYSPSGVNLPDLEQHLRSHEEEAIDDPAPTESTTCESLIRAQRTHRNAKTIGMLAMKQERNQGRLATESWTSTETKCSWMEGRQRSTRCSKTR